ncbi:MAG: hypothetical protein MJ187_04995, partial [Alphaproteobacteria bacterium]|nr:hypothetical protein [Alphaproteobacteria bacterium]
TIIVQSALSAFNNAALATPAFVWCAILACPLFFVAAKYGHDFFTILRWRANNLRTRITTLSVGLIIVWLILFCGNYDVLRDNGTVLPFAVAAILCILCAIFTPHINDYICDKWKKATTKQKRIMVTFGGIGILVVGLADTHAWWGPILPIVAVLLGIAFGRRFTKNDKYITSFITPVIIAITTVILMQPEFFRFGQLGALSPAHLLFLMFTGIVATATIALKNVKPRERIYDSAFIKLKWMTRFVASLMVALFALTESVPVFLSMLLTFFIMFALSIVHAERTPTIDNLSNQLFALTLALFGIITTMPVITALAVAYMSENTQVRDFAKIKFLL